jgi:hypothetical protein
MVSTQDQSAATRVRLVGHASTVVTQKVYRKELRPVLTRGAEKMDIVFKSEANGGAIDRQLDRRAGAAPLP